MTRNTKINKTARVKKVKPSVEVSAAGNSAGCGTQSNAIPTSPIPSVVPVERLYNAYHLEGLLSRFLADARSQNRGESLLHIENARVHFESACQSLHLAEQSRRTL